MCVGSWLVMSVMQKVRKQVIDPSGSENGRPTQQFGTPVQGGHRPVYRRRVVGTPTVGLTTLEVGPKWHRILKSGYVSRA